VHFAYPSGREGVAGPPWEEGRHPRHPQRASRCCTACSFRVEPGPAGGAGGGRPGAGKVDHRLAGAPASTTWDGGAVRLSGRRRAGFCRSTSLTGPTLGMVTQDGPPVPRHDSGEKPCLFSRARGRRRRAVAFAAPGPGWAALVESLPDGLDTVVGEARLHASPAGERQRLTIARLLLAKPRVVILDEGPPPHLDSTSEAAVQAALVEALGRPHGPWSSPTACRRSGPADAIIVIEDGRGRGARHPHRAPRRQRPATPSSTAPSSEDDHPGRSSPQ